MIDEKFKDYVSKQTLENLEKMILRVNKEKYPENIEFVKNRIKWLNDNPHHSLAKKNIISLNGENKISNKASLFKRAIASFIDVSMVSLPFTVIIYFTVFINLYNSNDPDNMHNNILLIKFRGKTVGNFITKTKIINSNEKELLSLFQSLKRRIIFIGAGLFGCISLIYNIHLGKSYDMELFSINYYINLPSSNIYDLINSLFTALIYASLIMILVRKDKRGIHDFLGVLL
ncbi:MAG: RDD family protein [Candidatus Cloacimonetes bacterium]|nr:RDD family protein [Candidatus Cloacimonadota bacterium]